jgi:hypothetical protein
MGYSDAGYDFDRYRKLLAEADDEPKRLALIDLLIEEKAKDRLARHLLRTRLSVLGIKSEPYVQNAASMEKNLHRDPT